VVAGQRAQIVIDIAVGDVTLTVSRSRTSFRMDSQT
jgi:hypothetical protein